MLIIAICIVNFSFCISKYRSFQRQLLLQDFVPGREIKCGVEQINQEVTSKKAYHLKLLFDDLGPLPLEIDDALEAAVRSAEISDRRIPGDSLANGEFEDDDDDEIFEDTDEEDGTSSVLTQYKLSANSVLTHF